MLHPMLALGLSLAALIGLSLGLLGGGGSILTVPIFVYVLGYAPKVAIAMSLPVVGATSLVGALHNWRYGYVRPRTALVFGIVAMGGAFGGAHLAVYLSGEMQLVLLAVVMLSASLSMLRSARLPAPPAADGSGSAAPRARMLVVPVALGVGLLTGLVGIGGGFLIVPALAVLLRLPMPQAVGTSLLIIALNAAAGFAGHVGREPLPWAFMALFTLIAIAGLHGGLALGRTLSPGQLKRAFAVFLIAVSALILVQNRAVLAGGDAATATKASRP
jgi:uncharacterized membrane protein YfcA